MTDRPLLLDTHIALWLAAGRDLEPSATAAMLRADAEGLGLYLSPISAWEIGMLVAKGRLALSQSPADWLDAFFAKGVHQAELSSAILVQSSFLPGTLHADPADRILVATARTLGLTLLTHDQKLLSYAAVGHLHAIAC